MNIGNHIFDSVKKNNGWDVTKLTDTTQTINWFRRDSITGDITNKPIVKKGGVPVEIVSEKKGDTVYNYKLFPATEHEAKGNSGIYLFKWTRKGKLGKWIFEHSDMAEELFNEYNIAKPLSLKAFIANNIYKK